MQYVFNHQFDRTINVVGCHQRTSTDTSHLQDVATAKLAKAQIPLRQLSPKLPVGKVVDPNHESRRHKPFQHVCNKVRDKSTTNPFMSL